MASKCSLFCVTALLASSLGLSAVDLSSELASGSIWRKDRQNVCSTDFVGLRYMPIDDYTIRLCPRLTVGEADNNAQKKKASLKAKSDLTIGKLEFGETIVRWNRDSNDTMNMLGLVYNRGDDGEITKAEFAKLIKKSIKELDAMTSKVGYVRESKGKGDEDHVGLPGLRHWYWEWADGVLLLEASATEMENGEIRPEFIRLKMGPTPEAIATGGADNFSSGKWMQQNVKKEGGKVYIAGIPMVDQGQKGYCAVATVARVFAYYGADAVDQHALAQLCDTLTEGGTYVHLIEKALNDMGKQFHFLPQILCYSYNCKGGIPSNQLKDFVESYVNNGAPVIWTIDGHMRMIIGYNKSTNEIYYSDSWGQGHEMKPMSLNKAAKMTICLHVIVPTR